MTLNTTTTYTVQNAFTKSLLAQIPGGPGLKGFCAWAGLTTDLTGMLGWNLVAQESDYQIVNAYFSTSAIAGNKAGDVFVYTQEPAPDQIWTIAPVSGLYSTYTLLNTFSGLLAYDPSGCGVTGLPQSTAAVDPYNPARFYWTFFAQQ